MGDMKRERLKRAEWLPLTRNLNWTFKYVSESEVFPPVISGTQLPMEQFDSWDEPYKTTYFEYIDGQSKKGASINAVRDLVGNGQNLNTPTAWLNSLKIHAAALPLAEFAAVVGNLRAARFAKNSAWRNLALFGALDEFRHTEIPLLVMHGLIPQSEQFDWTHKFYHSRNWVSIAARHMTDELLLLANPIEFAIATNFVFENGFTNLQFVGLSAIANSIGDHVFEKMIKSIQTDEARHSQIGPATIEILLKHDPEYVQRMLDKWFWRSWHIFAVVTGFSMDYLTPLEHRKKSFKEFMEEWVIDQYFSLLRQYKLKEPWYWEIFQESLEHYHHRVYLSAYTYRTTVWFDMAIPSPEEREWLREKYPRAWPSLEENWKNVESNWRTQPTHTDFNAHGTSIIGFCDLCQMVLCEGSADRNRANVLVRNDRKYVLCSEPCRWIFENEFERYGEHKDLVKRVLNGEAPGNLLEMVTKYFGLTPRDWGKDMNRGNYSWIKPDRELHKEGP